MILFYRVLTFLLYPLIIFLIFLRKIFKKEDPIRYKEKLFPSKFNFKKRENSKLIWFHAASIGEFKSILPIIENLKSSNNDFLVTTVTYSSGKLAAEELKKFDNVYHRYLPVDIEFVIKKFLTLWKPTAIFLVDSEIWPNLILETKKLKIPIALINGRITKKSFNRWNKVPYTAKIIFGSFDLCLASSLESKNYLIELKAKNIFYSGNIKLINRTNTNLLNDTYKDILKKKIFWLAVSTHEGEEVLCIKTHKELKKKFNKVTTIIAPRHIERVTRIKKLCENHKLETQILNKNDDLKDDKEIIIINFFGSLASFFKYSKSVFMGKSTMRKLKDVSGQNPIEPAKYGCKIYHGPYVYNFREIYQVLETYKISEKINNEFDLAKNISLELNNENKDYERFSKIMNNLESKTLNDTMSKIKNFLLYENK